MSKLNISASEAQNIIPKSAKQPVSMGKGDQMLREMKTKHSNNARAQAAKLGLPPKARLEGKTEMGTPKMLRYKDSTMAEVGIFEKRKRRAAGGACGTMREKEAGHRYNESMKHREHEAMGMERARRARGGPCGTRAEMEAGRHYNESMKHREREALGMKRKRRAAGGESAHEREMEAAQQYNDSMKHRERERRGMERFERYHMDDRPQQDRKAMEDRRTKGGMCGRKRAESAAGGHWIQGTIKHPGALHKEMGIPMGKKIPHNKLEKAAHKGSPLMRKRANLALTLEKMHK